MTLKRVAVLAIAMAAFCGAAKAEESTWDRIQKTGKIRAGCAVSEPWFYKDPATGEWSGVGPGIAAKLAEELQVKWECVETTWANGVAGLQANNYDMMVALDATPQRALAADFAEGTLLYYAVGVLLPKDSKITTWAELNNPQTTIGVALGSSNDRAITKLLPKANIERSKTYAESLASFYAGRSQGVGGPSMSLLFSNRDHLDKYKVVLPMPASVSTMSIGVRKETDKRWRDWLTVAMQYYYYRGDTAEIYYDFVKKRGLDPSLVPPITLEEMRAPAAQAK
ncbi:transporter substrate-binding domain-containing protein [Xanthobacter sp. 126]|uniref:transporter substrate-binding domain-containing protein n=1 Tax=Xanthobacter sp. 126 TaxID=1131814 RepID=UPI0018CC0333|nr:transporter substrate-binding domain-containing protein [Xanthobacter sp. 126]